MPRPEQPGARAWWWAVAAVIVLLGMAAWWQRNAFGPARRGAQASPAFRTVKAWAGRLEKTVRVAGVTGAERFAMILAPQMYGTRTGRNRQEFSLTLQTLAEGGSYVKKGDIIAEFDRQYIQQRMDDFKAMVDQHERNVTRLRAILGITQASYDQLLIRSKAQMEKAAQDLKKIPILSANNAERYRLDYEEARSRYEEAQKRAKLFDESEGASIRRAEIDFRQTQMEYERAQRAVDRLRVRAPIGGMVVLLTTHRNHENVQISAGDQIGTGQPYMRIVDLSNMVVNASVNQVDGHGVRVGQEAKVHFDAYPELELPAKVIAVGAFAVSTGWRGNYVRSVPIRLRLDRTDERVIPDLSVSADLVFEHADDAVIVPREAVFESPDDQKQVAYVRAGDGWEERTLDVVLANNTDVAVRAGVKAGEVLAAEIPARGASEASQ